MFDIAIKNGLTLINDDFTLSNIGIEGNRINYVGKEEIKGEILIDAKDKIIVPGLFNAHNHSAMALFRGYAEGLPLKDWLKKIWEVEKSLKPEDVYWGAMLGALEMIKSGTTAFSDHYFHMDSVGKAVLDSGLRGVICFGMMDNFDHGIAEDKIKNGIEFVRKWSSKHSRIKPALGPHSLYTCSLKLLENLKEISGEMDVKIHIHGAESQEEVKFVQNKYGKKPIELLHQIGLLNKNLILAHAIWLDSPEISILGDKNVNVVHNPISNLKLAHGIAKIKEMIDNGINVCLGTDGAASNNNYNMFEEIKFTALLQKHRLDDTMAIPEKEVFAFATRNGYRAYEFDGGSIEKGKLADLVLINKKTAQFTPIYDPFSSLVYSTYGCEVTHSIIDGKLLMENGMTNLNEEKILEKVMKISNRFRMGY